MIAFIMEALAFQLIFLLVYDHFLKGETFFNWNRLYLLATFTGSLVLPLVEITYFRNVLPGNSTWNSLYFQNLNGVTVSASSQNGIFTDFPWIHALFVAGVLLSILLFMLKIRRIYRLKKAGTVQVFADYTKIIVANSSVAFSFFRNLFIGDRIQGQAREQIIAHERVHISERHSLDLMYFELMRVILWFNPMVYLYQSRISELHEYIADERVPMAERENQYHLLLSHAFNTDKISFINQFFKSSLIKKRIVMLKKTRTPGIWKFKYLLLVPVVILMLCYSACKDESGEIHENSMQVGSVENLTSQEEQELYRQLLALSGSKSQWEFTVSDGNATIRFMEGEGNSYISGPNGEHISARMVVDGKITDESGTALFGAVKPVPFRMVEQAPLFPGCEDAEDPRGCFNGQLMEHIRKNFNYPKEAIDQGISGRVAIMFTIDENGKVADVRSRGPHEILEAEAERIILRLPDMQPGRQQDNAVKVYYSIPITFQLD